MIANDTDLTQAIEQLQRMYRALAALRKEVWPVSPRNFALLAEGPEEEISRLQAAIDVYTGRTTLPELQEDAEQVEEHSGDLREIDLDNHSFILRNAEDVHELRCVFEDDLLETAKVALDRRVQVTGIRRLERGRRSSGALRVIRLEVLEAKPL